jgi:lipopolysaccharide transport system ATP-binding protein
MAVTVIEASGLGKKYRLGGDEPAADLRDTIAMAASRFMRRMARSATDRRPDEFWALKDVAFEVRSGDVLGIVGPNGAGKSTLLKILSRITEPTEGTASIRGHLASLLEVGTGFHPDLTGRENVFLNGALLGMSRADIRARLDEIVAFAEVDAFVDTPVKRYSSGMYVRLAFAVAAHLTADILVIDEVLAVGDAAYQKKCIAKMNEVQRSGRTLLVVSHQMHVLQAICTRGLLLEHGRVVAAGGIDEVLATYRRSGLNGEVRRAVTPRLTWRGLLNRGDLEGLAPADDLAFSLAFDVGDQPIDGLMVDVALVNERNETVLHARSPWIDREYRVDARAPWALDVRFRSPRLAPGAYRLTVYAYVDDDVLAWVEEIDACTISAAREGAGGARPGMKGAVIADFDMCCSMEARADVAART